MATTTEDLRTSPSESSPTETLPTEEATIPGVSPMDERQAKFQRRAVLVLTILPFAGFLAAILVTWGAGLSIVDAAIATFFYFFTGLGVTIGFHRAFTHQSFVPSRALKIVLAVAGSMAVQGSVISWVATHRRHHAFSDQEGDPHSPHLDEGPGLAGVMRGLWHAHIGWLATPENTHPERWAPDMLKDKDIAKIDSIFGRLVLLSFVLPAIVGFAITQSFMGAVTAFMWGSLARVFLLHHVTWSINSICHFYGKQPFDSHDFSTNNWPLAIISMGESWHNNHHAFPTSAVHGIGRGQLDMSGFLIRLFEKMRLVRSVKLPSPKILMQKKVAEFKPRTRLVMPPQPESTP